MNLLERREPRLVALYELSLRAVIVLVVVGLLNDVFYADVNGYLIRAREIGPDFLPYRDFLWEYPPLGAVPLALIPLTGRIIEGFFPVFVASMVALEYASLRIIRAARPEAAWDITKFWTLAVLPVCAVAWFRLDPLPTFFTTLALVAVASHRTSSWSIVAGFAAKLWPVVLVVPLFLRRQWRGLAAVVLGCAAVVTVWYLFSPEGFRRFLEFRRGDDFQIESIPGALLLMSGREPAFRFGAVVVSDSGWEWVHQALTVFLIGFPLVAVALAWRRGAAAVNMVALTGALTAALLISTRLLSPQFLVWLAPFVAWLWVDHRAQGRLYALIVWLTMVVLQFYEKFAEEENLVLQALLNIRNGLLIVFVFVLLRIALTSRASDAQAVDRPSS